MTIEDRLSRALSEEASRRDVDTTALWARTRDRLDERPTGRPRGRMLAAATVATVLAAGAVGVTALERFGLVDGAVPMLGGPSEGGVASDFTCPEQTTYAWYRPETITDDYLEVSLDGGPEAEAERQEADRFEFDQTGDRAVLRLGGADGELTMVTEFRRHADAWDPYRTVVCGGESIAVPTEREWSLGLHGTDPYPSREMVWRDQGDPVLIDDRGYYDGAGRQRHRTIYAHLCEGRLCITSGEPTAQLLSELPGGLRPHDARSLFFPPDELVERTHPYGLWLLYDADGTVSSVSAQLADDTTVRAQQFRAATWPGRLHALLAPYDEVAAIMVQPVEGRARSYAPEELPGHGPPG